MKELGILVRGASALSADLASFFEEVWSVAGTIPLSSPAYVTTLVDTDALVSRPVPCWSPLRSGARISYVAFLTVTLR